MAALDEAELKIAPGTILADKYRLVREIGRGGVGVVYEAEHLKLRQRVALKIMSRALAKESNVTARFEREARAMATLHSPFVTAVSDVDVLSDGTPYMVMELLDGRDLQRELRERGPLPIGEAVEIMLLACRGLAAVHAAGIVHRDLKPSNLFLVRGAALTVKVMDFGVSKMADDDVLVTHDGSTLGTPAYMAPEQVRSARDADPRADVWSLGVILFRCLTGRLPFDGEGITGMAVAITNNPPLSLSELRPEVPRGLVALVERMLTKDPSQRTASVATVAAELAQYTESDYVESDDTDPKFTLPKADEPAEHVTSHVRPSSPDLALADAASAASGLMSLTPTGAPAPRRRSPMGFFIVLVVAVVGVVMSAAALVARRVAVSAPSASTQRTTAIAAESLPPVAVPVPGPGPSAAPSTSASIGTAAPTESAAPPVATPSATTSATASATATAPGRRTTGAKAPRKPNEPSGAASTDPALPPLL